MSEILLDQVKVQHTGDMGVRAVVRAAAGEPPPGRAVIRVAARATDESRSFPATVHGIGERVWSISATIPDHGLAGFSSDADFLDVFVDVALGERHVTRRLVWDERGRAWLPYPTLTRKLSLTEVTG